MDPRNYLCLACLEASLTYSVLRAHIFRMKAHRKAWELLPRNAVCSVAIFRRYPYVLLAAITFVLWVLFFGYHYPPFQSRLRTANLPSKGIFDGQWNATRDARNLLMNDTQCDLAFPNLFKEIDRAVESRKKKPVTLKEVESVQPTRGYNHAMIYDNQVGG